MGMISASVQSRNLDPVPESSAAAAERLKPGREWSHYQKAVFDWVQRGKGNLIVEAVAGSGKSSLVEECCKRLEPGAKALFLAFNKSIAVELDRRIGSRAECRTLNSVGFALLRRARPGIQMDEKASQDRVREILKGRADEWTMRRGVRKGLDILKAFCLPNQTDLYEELDQAQRRMGEGLKSKEMEAAVECFMRGLGEKADFDDQIWAPVYLEVESPKYDWIFVDEAQDLSPNQHRLLMLLARREARVVCVGDSRQAIYGFRGAATDSLGKLRNMLNAAELPLSITYRCPKKVVALAQEFCPHIEASPDAEEGEVKKGKITKWLGPGEGELVVCRTTAPLIREVLGMISKGRKARVLGRDLGGGLIGLLTQAGVEPGLEAKKAAEKVAGMCSERYGQVIDTGGSESMALGWLDKADCIRALSFGCRSANDMACKLKGLFEESEQGISIEQYKGATFSTVHKAKGLEAEVVHVLGRDNMPHPRAVSDYDLQNENNVLYVALTRPKKTLKLVMGEREEMK